MDQRKRASNRALRPAMRSPGRPTAGGREDRVVFWLAVGDGMASVEAAKLAGKMKPGSDPADPLGAILVM